LNGGLVENGRWKDGKEASNGKVGKVDFKVDQYNGKSMSIEMQLPSMP
jgi:hypothetical protein